MKKEDKKMEQCTRAIKEEKMRMKDKEKKKRKKRRRK